MGGGRKNWSILPIGHLRVNVFGNQIQDIETLEEYRMNIEESLADRDSSWYLDLRYNFSICFSADDDEHKENLYYYDREKESLNIANAKQIMFLWQRITADIASARSNLSETEDVVYNTPSVSYTYIDRIEALDVIRMLRKELLYLEECFDMVEPYYNEIKDNKLLVCEKGEILYVYAGNIICHKHKHNIVQATALCYDRNDNEVDLNVEYCTDCNKYLLEYH